MIKKIKQKWRRKRLALNGITETRQVSQQVVGSGGGQWVVSPLGLSNNSVIYSFGAGTDISFDLDMQKHFGCKVHVFDPTPRSIEWINQQQLPDGVDFHPCGIANHDGSITFYPPRRESSSHFSPVPRYRNESSGQPVEAPVNRLSTLMQQLGDTKIDVLKIDIEGGEYDVLPDILSSGFTINQLLLEFHHAYATIPYAKTLDAVTQIKRAGFDLFYISERTYEMSFIHNRVS